MSPVLVRQETTQLFVLQRTARENVERGFVRMVYIQRKTKALPVLRKLPTKAEGAGSDREKFLLRGFISLF